MPLAYLNDILGSSSNSIDENVTNIVILQVEGREFGLVVDAISDTQEIVVKPLGKHLKGIGVYSGATIMGDGKVALILDVIGLAKHSGMLGDTRLEQVSDRPAPDPTSIEDVETLILFRAGDFERIAAPLAAVARLEEIPASKIERATGQLVTQYRGQILPLVPVAKFLNPRVTYLLPQEGDLQVIVFKVEDQTMGLIVDQILDIVEDRIAIRRKAKAPGFVGSVVIGQKVTDLLDLETVFADCEPSAYTSHDTEVNNSRSLEILSAALTSDQAITLETLVA